MHYIYRGTCQRDEIMQVSQNKSDHSCHLLCHLQIQILTDLLHALAYRNPPSTTYRRTFDNHEALGISTYALWSVQRSTLFFEKQKNVILFVSFNEGD